MQTIWFVIALVFLILSVAGLVTAAVLCFCRQRAATPRHPHNAHNAQTHPPVSFPCEFRKKRAPHSPSCCVIARPPSFHPFLPFSFLFPMAPTNRRPNFPPRFTFSTADFVPAIFRLRIENLRVSHLLFIVCLRFCSLLFFFFSSIVRSRDGWVDLDETVCTMNIIQNKGSLIPYNYR